MDVLGLHRTLVSIESVSRNEGPIMDWVFGYLQDYGIKVERIGQNVVARAGSGPAVLFNTHLDTVPANSSWTRDPWAVESVGGKVYGLGSNDAKASAAAMIGALVEVHQRGGPCELTLMLVSEEEVGGRGTEVLWPQLLDRGYSPVGIVVGEPTELQIGVAQKGLIILRLITRGDACHAANANRLGAKNPVWELCDAVSRLVHVNLGPVHPQLGETTLQPTVLQAAQAHNQVPGEAVCVVDIRTVPGLTPEQLADRVEKVVGCEVDRKSLRLAAYECPRDARIIKAAMSARPESKPFGSPTMSDQVYFQGWPAIKCGPGISARSHTADEFVLESEILEATAFYGRLLEEMAK